jgi:hypothetical protein
MEIRFKPIESFLAEALMNGGVNLTAKIDKN